MAVDLFSVKNFDRFQHYKDRSPPWIKLYTALLEDYEFSLLSDTHKAHLILIWVLASKVGNKLPVDPTWITRKIGAAQEVDLQALFDAGWIISWDEEAERGGRENWKSRYISKELRKKILSQDGDQCLKCKSKHNLEIDHIIPISAGGDGDEGNLQTLCRSCNRKKRAKLENVTKTELYDVSADAEHSPGDDAPQMRSPEREREREAEQRQKEGATFVAKIPDNLDRQKWAFKGRVVRLTRSDYDRWAAAYPNIDLTAELTAADDYYSQKPPKDGKWFFPVSNWCRRANQGQNKLEYKNGFAAYIASGAAG